jgi:hypothetical protein
MVQDLVARFNALRAQTTDNDAARSVDDLAIRHSVDAK